MSRFTRIIQSGILALLALVLIGCSPDNPSTGSEEKPLRVEWTQWWGDYTMIIAREKGFFEKHGVEVEPVYYDVFSQAVPDLASGKIDGGLFGISDLLTANSTSPVRAVAVYDDGGVDSIVSIPEITQIEDLRGKAIGTSVGYSREIVVREMLTSAGMTIGDVRLVSMNPEEIEDSMPESIQAGQTWEPFTAQALANGNNILYSTKDTGSVFPDLIVFRKNVITERPDDIQAFVNAWFDAVEFRLTNPDEANQIISQAIGSEVSQTAGDPKLFTRADNLAVLSTNPGEGKRYIYGVLALNIDFLKSIGGLTFPVDPQVILDPTFMQNAGD